jgi:hypothetical protein
MLTAMPFQKDDKEVRQDAIFRLPELYTLWEAADR